MKKIDNLIRDKFSSILFPSNSKFIIIINNIIIEADVYGCCLEIVE